MVSEVSEVSAPVASGAPAWVPREEVDSDRISALTTMPYGGCNGSRRASAHLDFVQKIEKLSNRNPGPTLGVTNCCDFARRDPLGKSRLTDAENARRHRAPHDGSNHLRQQGNRRRKLLPKVVVPTLKTSKSR